jgi:superfamily I DNA/RNA helicase
VIDARELTSLDQYLAAPRAGRLVPLTAAQRTAVWAIYGAFTRVLARKGLKTWAQLRRRALEIVKTGRGSELYDAVVIDEAQDLDPTVLRLLVTLSKGSNRVFVTADANQSIYGGSFRWADVHEDLRFRGRTEILRRNYRSTREIGSAAESYIQTGSLEPRDAETSYVESGPLPTVRHASTDRFEMDLLTGFFREATRQLHLGIGAGVVLVPSADTGRHIADQLCANGIEACFMSGRDLDLERRAVKVLTLKSVKGLEFPMVAIAGFVAHPEAGKPRNGLEEETAEWLARERRTLFVGMTRAMRALLIVAPLATTSDLFAGFDGELWNIATEQMAS